MQRFIAISFGRPNSISPLFVTLLHCDIEIPGKLSAVRKWYSTLVEDGAFCDPSAGSAAATLFAVVRNENGPWYFLLYTIKRSDSICKTLLKYLYYNKFQRIKYVK